MSLFDAFLRPDPATVVREHGPAVYRQLRRIFGPSADVDDAYQMVFVEVLRALPSFRGRAKLSTWIRRITWNVAYQEMRMSYRRGATVPLEHEPEGIEPVSALECREALECFYTALEKLDPKQRVVVAMYDVEGCTLKEISAAVGRPLQTVASQLASGRAALARALASPEEAVAGLGPASSKEGV